MNLPLIFFLLAGIFLSGTAIFIYYRRNNNLKRYVDRKMKFTDIDNSFEAGILVMNLKVFRETYTTKYIMELAAKENWKNQDQDVLNMLCEYKTRMLDMSWNVFHTCNGIEYAPEWLREQYFEARKHPKAIQYAGKDKPWLNPETPYAALFWAYARKSPFYEIMLSRMTRFMVRCETQTGKLSYNIKRAVRCVYLYGLAHTIGEIRKK